MDAEGHFDLNATRKIFQDVIWASAHARVGRILIDVRDATTTITAAQLGTLADVCREISPPDEEHKIAILNRPRDETDRALLLAGMAQDAGWNIAAFRDFERAFDWLSY
jgi:hypothetical protein